LSIVQRFLYTYAFNIFAFFFTFLSGVLLARTLGPESYGVLAYVIAVFGSIFYILDMGTSNALFTFASQETKDKKFYFVFLSYHILMILITIAFFTIAPTYILEFFNLNFEDSFLIIAIIGIYFRNSLWNVIKKIYESQRLSISINFFNGMSSALYFLLLLSANYFTILTIDIVLKIILVEYIIFSLIVFYLVPIEFNSAQASNFLRVSKSFFKYCLPLAPMMIFVGMTEFLRPWMINTYGGSAQQAYYSMSLQFNLIVIMFLTSIMNIFWKEIADSYKNKGTAAAAELYIKTCKYFLIFVCVFSFYLTFQSRNIILVLYLEPYEDAANTMRLICIYPILQLFGQLNGVVFYATEKTNILSKLAIFQGILFIIFAFSGIYILLNYTSGDIRISEMMALVLIIVTFIYVFMSSISVSKLLNFNPAMLHLLFIPIFIFAISFFSYQFVSLIISVTSFSNDSLVSLILNFIINITVMILILIKYPKILFINDEDLKIINEKLEPFNLKINTHKS
tara:strand:+ start:1792 stop:3324 length:1533 start_codon:yes stop_codon:yes gene_type:complete